MINPCRTVLEYLKPQGSKLTEADLRSLSEKKTKNADLFIDHVIYGIYEKIMDHWNIPLEIDVNLDASLVLVRDDFDETRAKGINIHESVISKMNLRITNVFSKCVCFTIISNKIVIADSMFIHYRLLLNKEFSFPTLKQLPNPKGTVGLSLYEAFGKGEGCDFKILVGTDELKTEIPFHKCVLSARCQVFNKMFESSMTEKQENTLNLSEYPETSVRVFLEFIYTDWVAPKEELTAREISCVLGLASMYDFPKLKEWCSRELTKKISAVTFLEIDRTARLHELKNLQNWLEVRIHTCSPLRDQVSADLRTRLSKEQPKLLTLSDSDWVETKKKTMLLIDRLGLSKMKQIIEHVEEDRLLAKNEKLNNELSFLSLL